MNACGKGLQWERALFLFDETAKMNLEALIITFNVAISACEKSHQWTRALTLLESASSAQLSPSIITCNTILSACGKGEQWQRALHFLQAEDMPRADLLSFNTAITACERAKQWQEALALLEQVELEQMLPDVITYNSTMSCSDGFIFAGFTKRFIPPNQRNSSSPSTPTEYVNKNQVKDLPYQNLVGGGGGKRGKRKLIPRDPKLLSRLGACSKAEQWTLSLELFRKSVELQLQLSLVSYNTAITACEKGQQWCLC